jgi:hypothetical protein
VAGLITKTSSGYRRVASEVVAERLQDAADMAGTTGSRRAAIEAYAKKCRKDREAREKAAEELMTPGTERWLENRDHYYAALVKRPESQALAEVWTSDGFTLDDLVSHMVRSELARSEWVMPLP